MDVERFIKGRVRDIDASGIRRVFDLAANLQSPCNLSIGQPHFDVPEPIKAAAATAIHDGFNRYTQTQGTADLRQKVILQLQEEFPSTIGAGEETHLREDLDVLITSGVSGALVLALLTCVGPGDEVLVADPYFVMYRHLVTLAGATPVFVDTYPDFQVTAQRIEPLLTDRSRIVLFNSPSNPTGVVASPSCCKEVAELCQRHNLLLLSDEIYDAYCYNATNEPGSDLVHCPSPASYSSDLLLLRGFSKTYAMTGWRLGYIVGPQPLIEQMTKLQQYSFVCAPSMAQIAGELALETDMSDIISQYRRKRDYVVERLLPYYELTCPGGALYAFPEVPPRLQQTATEFVESAVAQNLLIIPGSVFSQRDTHFRLSYACDDAMLEQGLDILVAMAQ